MQCAGRRARPRSWCRSLPEALLPPGPDDASVPCVPAYSAPPRVASRKRFRIAERVWERGGPRSALHVLPVTVCQLRAEFVSHPPSCSFHLFDELVQVAARTRDGHDSQRRRLPCDGLIHLGDRDVEPLPQLILHRTHHLPPVLERLGMFDTQFEG